MATTQKVIKASTLQEFLSICLDYDLEHRTVHGILSLSWEETCLAGFSTLAKSE